MYGTKTVKITRQYHYIHLPADEKVFGRDLIDAVEKLPRHVELDGVNKCPCGCGGVSAVFFEDEEEDSDETSARYARDDDKLMGIIFATDARALELDRKVDVFAEGHWTYAERNKRWYQDFKKEMLTIVGLGAKYSELRNPEMYDAFYSRLIKKLGL